MTISYFRTSFIGAVSGDSDKQSSLAAGSLDALSKLDAMAIQQMIGATEM